MSRAILSPALLIAALALPAPATAVEPSADYLDPLEARIVEEVNLARTRPDHYADLIARTRSQYEGRFRVRPGRLRVRTEEGVAAVDEAVAYLRRTEPLAPLTPSPGMSRAAQDHADDQSRSGGTGHVGSDGGEVPQRLARYGRWQKRVGENIAYGDGDAREVVMQLIIDDGYPSRGHRENFFQGDFARIGVGCAPHRDYRQVCVMTLAGGFLESGEAAGPEPRNSDAPAEDHWRGDDLWEAIRKRLNDKPAPD
jgi:uncharacterized protein YkwD